MKLPVMIEAVGRAVGTQIAGVNRTIDNIMVKLEALQRKIDQLGDQNGQRQ